MSEGIQGRKPTPARPAQRLLQAVVSIPCKGVHETPARAGVGFTLEQNSASVLP